MKSTDGIARRMDDSENVSVDLLLANMRLQRQRFFLISAFLAIVSSLGISLLYLSFQRSQLQSSCQIFSEANGTYAEFLSDVDNFVVATTLPGSFSEEAPPLRFSSAAALNIELSSPPAIAEAASDLHRELRSFNRDTSGERFDQIDWDNAVAARRDRFVLQIQQSNPCSRLW